MPRECLEGPNVPAPQPAGAGCVDGAGLGGTKEGMEGRGEGEVESGEGEVPLALTVPPQLPPCLTQPCPSCPADDLKYDLHVLFVTHGKRCPSCSKQGLGLVLPSKAGSAKPKAAAAASGAAVECPLADLKPLPGQLKSASPARQRGSKAAGGGKQPSVKAAAGGEAAAGGRKRRKVAAADAKLCD